MTKVIIALVAVLLALLLAIGGLFVYRNIIQPAQASVSEEEDAVDPEKTGKGPLGRMRDAKTPSDIPNLLTYAFKKSLDAVGWIDVPGTDINNVIMQGNDNLYYERRNEDGESDIYGCYFLDVECALGRRSDFLSNTVVYGHSDLKDNPDGPRFSQLFRFVDDDFAAENKYLYLTTLYGRYAFEIFSVFYTDISFDYIRVHMTDEQMLALANQAKSLSIRDYGIQPQAGDKLLTLSTCSVRDGNDGTHRFVVMGRLVQAEESEAPLVPEEARTTVDNTPSSQPEQQPESSGEDNQQPMPSDNPAPIQQPDIPQPDMAQPDIQMPDFQMPDIQIPDFQMPDMQMPNFP